MTAKKNTDAPVVDLSERIERQMADRGVKINVGDGEPIEVPPPELWSAEVVEAANNPDISRDDFPKHLLGEDAWQRFLDNGGTPRLFDVIVRERWDASAGE